MKVSELIKELQKLEPDLLVLMSNDAEGNKITRLDFIDLGRWNNGIGEYDIFSRTRNAVCLWPEN